MFPSNGQLKRRPLHSAGSFGQVPPPQRYYGTLRLPAAHLAALRCLRLAIPSFVPCSSPPARDRAVDQPGVGKPGLQAGSHDGDGRVSQVPERPSCPCALFLDPGRTEVRQAIAAPRHGPRLCQQRWLPQAEDFGARSHGIGTRCLRFAMEVARHHARLASGCWPSFAGRDSLTRRVAMKGFRVQSLPPFSSLPDAMTPIILRNDELPSRERGTRRARSSFGFPLPPLKFRTVGFPQYGFKWTVSGDLRRHPGA